MFSLCGHMGRIVFTSSISTSTIHTTYTSQWKLRKTVPYHIWVFSYHKTMATFFTLYIGNLLTSTISTHYNQVQLQSIFMDLPFSLIRVTWIMSSACSTKLYRKMGTTYQIKRHSWPQKQRRRSNRVSQEDNSPYIKGSQKNQ